jgi:hypothetical protein
VFREQPRTLAASRIAGANARLVTLTVLRVYPTGYLDRAGGLLREKGWS